MDRSHGLRILFSLRTGINVTGSHWRLADNAQ